jgi:hypothetical protein
MLEAAAELRSVVAGWDAATDSGPVVAGPERLTEALRQIADAQSGVWGWIARAALDECRPPAHAVGNGDARALEPPGGRSPRGLRGNTRERADDRALDAQSQLARVGTSARTRRPACRRTRRSPRPSGCCTTTTTAT